MSFNSSIEWTESTWNPITGCNKISPGCKNCYAERMSNRLKSMGVENYARGFNLTLHQDSISLPLNWKRPQLIFVNSMSDLFHESVPVDFIIKIFETMKKADWHIFQVLTKRSDRLLQIHDELSWTDNIWMGVSVESQDYIHRIEQLKKTNSLNKFISFEPLLSNISDINLKGIDWVIVGGESGPKSRPIKAEWVNNLLSICKQTAVPFFFKQWGGFNKKKNGRILNDRTWDEIPIKMKI